ncbi:hypothetical protein K8I61_07925 [bacterium]|nr:hypothetical protein [bacterium]
MRDPIATAGVLFEKAASRADPNGIARGQRFLVVPMRGQVSYVNLFESLVATAMRLRGADVAALVCDGSLPACDNAPAHVDKAALCVTCAGAAKDWWAHARIDAVNIGALVGVKEREVIRSAAERIPGRALFSEREAGIPVGELARMSSCRHLARGTIDARHEATMRAFAETARVQLSATREMIRRFAPTRALLSHAIYALWGAPAAALAEARVTFWTWGRAYLRDRVVLTHDTSLQAALAREPVSLWADCPLSARDEALLDRYLASKDDGAFDMNEHRYQTRRAARAAPDAAISGRLRVGLFTNVVWDAAIHSSSSAFDDMTAWVMHTIERLKDRKDVELIVRVHPAETRHPAHRTAEPILEQVRERFASLPPHIRLVGPDSPISTYDLAPTLDAALVYTTTLGHELAARGMPVITAGDARYANKGFTFDARSTKEYDDLLSRLADIARPAPERRERARRYAYHYNFRRAVPFRAIDTRDGARLAIDDIDDLMPGGRPEIDLICERIVAGEDILWDGPNELPDADDGTDAA